MAAFAHKIKLVYDQECEFDIVLAEIFGHARYSTQLGLDVGIKCSDLSREMELTVVEISECYILESSIGGEMVLNEASVRSISFVQRRDKHCVLGQD